MDPNYKVDDLGIVHQIETKIITYDPEYVKAVTEVIPDKGLGTAKLRCDILLDLKEVYSVLDIGYGNGKFLDVCKGWAYTTYGFDVSGVFLDGHHILETMEEVFSRDFDVITFFDSLEHIPDLSFISKLRAKYVVVSVPWYHPELGDDWFKNWKHRKPNEHLHHFDQPALSNLFKKHGYACIRFGNFEDVLRPGPDKDVFNILTCVFEKI